MIYYYKIRLYWFYIHESNRLLLCSCIILFINYTNSHEKCNCKMNIDFRDLEIEEYIN